ncbi:hypothetical protein GOP47_0014989 [Adiantum capillus-veneris]|uniref:Uncharacterized protein n=1 Tax=Adiantum capillus-veneris TaxID=13818 RepID=A0A9D4ZFB2_ADICA|nr:hypothetical protein GOP47_0014989 [Adiantum capillus-veneris]
MRRQTELKPSERDLSLGDIKEILDGGSDNGGSIAFLHHIHGGLQACKQSGLGINVTEVSLQHLDLCGFELCFLQWNQGEEDSQQGYLERS